MDFVKVNCRVKVVAGFGIDDNIGRAVRPLMMTYGGRDIKFSQLGMYHPSTHGRKMVHVFDTSDGSSDYRLELDAERLTWTLIAITTV
jgi:hypothetical protein